MSADQIRTFGDVRRMIISTITDLKDGKIDTARGMAIAANFKVLNDNVMAEIAAAKMAMATEGKAHNFGKVVGMGQRLIGSDNPPPQAPSVIEG